MAVPKRPNTVRLPAAMAKYVGRVLEPSRLVGLTQYVLIRLRNRRLRVGFFRPGKRLTIQIGRTGTVTFGRGITMLDDFTARVGGKLVVGSDVFFNRGCYIDAYSHVEIGDGCLFGEWVSIHDMNHGIELNGQPFWKQPITTAPIIIGRNVWVGTKVTILPGVTIGDNAVIGANAVVTRDVPANTMAAGVPARVIRSLAQGDSQAADPQR